jgi:hypothetical protein
MDGEKLEELTMTPDGGFKVVNTSGQGANDLQIDDYEYVTVVWPFRDLITFTAANSCGACRRTAWSVHTTDRGRRIWRCELDQYTVRSTKLPNDPSSNQPFTETGFFEHVRRNFPTFCKLPRDGTARVVGTILEWRCCHVEQRRSPGSGAGIYDRSQIIDAVAGRRSRARAGVMHRVFISTGQRPSLELFDSDRARTRPGITSFWERGSSVCAPEWRWFFYVRAADRMGGRPEWLMRNAVYRGQDVYWKYFQESLKAFVEKHDGSAEIRDPFVAHVDLAIVKRIVRRPQTDA